MSQPTLHFCHANGFPASSYQVLFDHLRDSYHIDFIDRLGHHPDYPVNNNWTNLRDELIGKLERQYTQAVIGVGHSLGGAVTFMAALKRPDLFRAVVLLDVPLLSHLEAWIVRISKQLNLIDYLTPAKQTLGRRTQWASRKEAVEYFRHKPLFRHFDQRCLVDYVENGTVATEKGVTLAFDADTEIDIFRTIPHNLPWRYRYLKVPAGVIAGQHSNVIKPYQMKRMVNTMGLLGDSVRGGHMFPFEHPKETAEHLRRLIDRLLQQRQAA